MRFYFIICALLAMFAGCGGQESIYYSIYAHDVQYEHLESGQVTRELVLERDYIIATDKQTGESNTGRMYPDPRLVFDTDLIDIYRSEPQSSDPTYRIDIIDRFGQPTLLNLDINTIEHDETRQMIEQMEKAYQHIIASPPPAVPAP